MHSLLRCTIIKWEVHIGLLKGVGEVLLELEKENDDVVNNEEEASGEASDGEWWRAKWRWRRDGNEIGIGTI